MKFLIFNILIIIPFISGLCQNLPKKQNNNSGKTIILKFKPEYKEKQDLQNFIIDGQIKQFFGETRIKKIEKIYKNHSSPKSIYDKNGNQLVDLSLIYRIELSDTNSDIERNLNKLIASEIFEYAEIESFPELFYNPNDPNTGSQYYLDIIKAFDAWDISKGDSNIIIGITDTGIDFNNFDLMDNVFYNYSDPFDGIDNDFDGYVDNFEGWDLGDNDRNPQWNEITNGYEYPHGIMVSGSASARTDNAIGIAGPGFRTKLLPIKISDKYLVLTKSYEGIVYAADHGCSIINCSWGGSLGNRYGQDIINYATFNKNSLVVASAGNNNNDGIFFPASYENVLSVAGTNSLDYKWTPSFDGTMGGSNYGIYVDVCAPAVNIYSTYINNTYIGGAGTSYSSPIVSGCAAIVKAHYPTFSALQIAEVLRVTADNIDTIPFNAPYQDMLGAGRVNLFRALSDTLTPSIRFQNICYSANNGSVIIPGSTVEISGKFTNYLTPTVNCVATISSESPYINIVQPQSVLGNLGTLDTLNNNSEPFIIEILSSAPYDEQIIIRINYNDTLYNAFEYFDFTIYPSYIHLDTNNFEV
ncbi:MAG: S8 family serine peptidase, partial [Bacteroidota bacterium]